MFSSLRMRLSLSYLAVIALAIGLLAFLTLTFLQQYLMKSTEDSLLAQASIVSQTLIPGSALGGLDSSANSTNLSPAYNTIQNSQVSTLYLNASNIAPGDQTASHYANLSYLSDASLQLGSQLTTRIRIVDSSGIVIVDSQREQQGSSLRGDLLVVKVLAGQQASLVDDETEKTMHVALPIVVDDHIVGAIYLSQPLRDVTAVLNDVRTRLLIALAIALALSGVAALLLARSIARPLHRLTAAASAVAQGRLDQEVPVRSSDEIGRLSRTFNEMTNRLRIARRTQTDFVADVSHELRTPLTSVKGMAETLRDGAVDDPDVRDRFLGTIEEETDRMIRLVNDLILLSQADSEALNLRRESINVAVLAQAAIKQLSYQAEGKGITIKIEIRPSLPPVMADADRIRQVIVNLLDNAIKYSRPGGAVTVSATATQDNSILIQVSDEGIGIPAADLPKIGRRFYRTDKARSRAQGGSGLGLAIAQTLVEAHGGRLWVESREGHGTKVSFTLPSA